jgi:hypothetical protein
MYVCISSISDNVLVKLTEDIQCKERNFWLGLVARMGETRNVFNDLRGKSDGTFGDLGVNVILKKCM